MYKTYEFDLSGSMRRELHNIDLRLAYVMKGRLHAGYHTGQFQDLVLYSL